MTGQPQLLQQSATHAWLFVPSAILLGALHGLEPDIVLVVVRSMVAQMHDQIRKWRPGPTAMSPFGCFIGRRLG